VHHIDYWAISDSGGGGATVLNNMIPLCSRHHHAAHEGGWKLKLDPETQEIRIRQMNLNSPCHLSQREVFCQQPIILTKFANGSTDLCLVRICASS
jgi:hypothetical protein